MPGTGTTTRRTRKIKIDMTNLLPCCVATIERYDGLELTGYILQCRACRAVMMRTEKGAWEWEPNLTVESIRRAG